MAIPSCTIYRSVKNAVLSSPISSCETVILSSISERDTNLNQKSLSIFCHQQNMKTLKVASRWTDRGLIYNIDSIKSNKV